MTQTNLSKIKTKFRTEGNVTGNFGAPKRRAGSKLSEVPVNDKDSLGSFPTTAEYEQRLLEALEKCEDRKLHHFIIRELEKIRAQRGGERVSHPVGPHCSINDHFVKSSQQ